MKVEYGDDEAILQQLQNRQMIKHWSIETQKVCWNTKRLFDHDYILCVSRSMQFWLAHVDILEEGTIPVASCEDKVCSGKIPMYTVQLFVNPPTRSNMFMGSNKTFGGNEIKQLL